MFAKEEFEQDLYPSYLVFPRFGQPVSESVPSFAGQGVDIAVWFSGLLLGMAAGQALFGELLEDGVDLPVALAPKVANADFDEFFDVVPGHGSIAEYAQDGVLAFVFLAHNIS